MSDLHRVRDAEGTYARSALLAPDCLDAIAKANLAFIELLRARAYADARLWRTITQRPALPDLTPDNPNSKFVRMAVCLTWHLSRSSDEAAILGLGMAPDVLRIWRGVELNALEEIASAAGASLTARFANHGIFWERLITSVVTRDISPSSSIRLLGLQLLAASRLSS